MITTPPDQMLPSTPMTGPSGAPAPTTPKRRLDPEQPAPVDPMQAQDYIAPGSPADLEEDANAPGFMVSMMRRHLPTVGGPRRL